MNITYTYEKAFTEEQVQKLFRSVEWISAEYPKRLIKALMNFSSVLTAWNGSELIGLVRVLDDSELVAYIHYVLVNPEYQGLGIASHMLEMIKKRYKNYLYIEVMPEDSNNAPFYLHNGFTLMEKGIAMQICNFSDKR